MRLSSIQAFSLAAALAVAGTALPGQVRAQVETREGIALQNQIYQLRQEVMVLRDQLNRGGAALVAKEFADPVHARKIAGK
jgi:uncharacterized protein YheU (UPF0270 family)